EPVRALECVIGVVDVRRMMLVVVDLHRAGIDVRLERVDGLRKGRQLKSHGRALYWKWGLIPNQREWNAVVETDIGAHRCLRRGIPTDEPGCGYACPPGQTERPLSIGQAQRPVKPESGPRFSRGPDLR